MSQGSSLINQNSTNEKLLENPFHPLDLSAHDLLIIYKRFDISSQANRNPQQELPIETIAQLISSIKGCKPSYIQKCISQALIKQTISWKDFLAFLDQESEVRHKIMDWLLHEKAIIRYKFENEYPFREKICKYFDEITDLNFIELGSDELMCGIVDYKKMILIDLTEGAFKQIDSFIKVDESTKKIKEEAEKKQEQAQQKTDKNKSLIMISHEKSELKKSFFVSKPKHKNNILSKSIQGSKVCKAKDQPNNSSSEEAYLKDQSKHIHSVFNIFTQLPLQQSVKVAGMMTSRIRDKMSIQGYLSNLKDKYSQYESEKKIEMYEKQKLEMKPLQKAIIKLNRMHKEKQELSYNPYRTLRSNKTTSVFEIGAPPGKKIGFERKEKDYFMEACAVKFNKELNCFAVIYYNFQISLIRVMREYNKIILSEQDILKINVEKDHKKNEVVEGVQFYKHRITNRWFLLVLIRIEYKNDARSRNSSIIKGYEVNPNCKNKSNTFTCYKFVDKKEEFVINLGNNQIMQILTQPQFGIHTISHNGKYIICKEDYLVQNQQINYWKIEAQQKFKGVNMSLSCVSISPQSNKALIGTIKGILIVYDLFSHHYKLRKVCYDAILKIHLNGDHAYLLTSKQKVIVYDIIRNEQIQVINVRNQERLHEKVTNFELKKDKIVCYGTCIRLFVQVVDESMQHQKMKMQNMYTWRLNKLPTSKEKVQIKSIVDRPESLSAEHVLTSANFIITLTQIHEAIFFSVKDLSVKFTVILDIPYDAKVMKMAFSQDQKLLAVLLFDQNIYIFNVYTQELFMKLSFNHATKYTTISFLDRKNQYFFATGTQTGSIYLNTFPTAYQKTPKLLDLHKKAVACTILRKNLLISTSEDHMIGIWQLPFNFLKYEIDLKKKDIFDYMTDSIGHFSESICFFKSLEGKIYELDIKNGRIKRKKINLHEDNLSAIDSCTGCLILADKSNKVSIWDKNSSEEGWKMKKQVKIETKNEIMGFGIVPSEKIVIFTNNEFMVWPFKSEKPGKFKTLMEFL